MRFKKIDILISENLTQAQIIAKIRYDFERANTITSEDIRMVGNIVDWYSKKHYIYIDDNTKQECGLSENLIEITNIRKCENLADADDESYYTSLFINNHFVTIEDFNKLSDRFKGITDAQTLVQWVHNNRKYIEDLQNRVTTNEKDIAQLQTDVSKNQDDIKDLQSEIIRIDKEIDNTNDLVGKLQNTIQTYDDKITSQVIMAVPIGTIMAYSGYKAPDGYLLCNGGLVNKTDYPELYNVIGTRYGSETSTKFRIPKLNDGRFLEGHTESGIYRSPGLPNLSGRFQTLDIGANERPAGAFRVDDTWASGKDEYSYSLGDVKKIEYNPNNTGLFHDYRVLLEANKYNSIYGNSDVVQPKSLTILYMIRAK